jgi:pimeloyl-ACP methyl ester carboxylesterase
VPLDHSGAVPGRLSLRVKRYTGDRSDRSATLLLAGTPGAAATELASYEYEAPGSNPVLFDQRGTGAGALRCRDLEAATDTDAGREAAACAALLGDRRGFFRTSDTVEDIETLRRELGLDRLTILGPGYGAYVAQRYAMRYPDRVERLLLEFPVDAAGLDPLYLDSMAAAGLPPLRIDGPGRLDGTVRIRESDEDLAFAVRGRIAGRRVRARVRVHSPVLDAFSEVEVEGGGGTARLAAVGGLLR